MFWVARESSLLVTIHSLALPFSRVQGAPSFILGEPEWECGVWRKRGHKAIW